jgi:hypothetical protein
MNKPEFLTTTTVPFAERYDNFIGGKWVAPGSGKYFDNISPVTGKVVCKIARSEAHDVEAALDAAHAAKGAWGRTSVVERALILIVSPIAWRPLAPDLDSRRRDSVAALFSYLPRGSASLMN